MAEIALDGPVPIRVRLRRSARARRLSLRISALDGRATLTVPKTVSDRAARKFVTEKRDWLIEATQRVAAPVDVAHGVEIPLRGAPHRITPARVPRVVIEDGLIQVPRGVRRVGRAVGHALRSEAQARLSDLCDGYAAQIDSRHAGVRLRDTRSRWGSCASDGRLMFSWRLILAPDDVLDYVAVHEVCHLRHMNHGPDFWALVSELCPDWRGHRDWLRKEGAALHRWRFGD